TKSLSYGIDLYFEKSDSKKSSIEIILDTNKLTFFLDALRNVPSVSYLDDQAINQALIKAIPKRGTQPSFLEFVYKQGSIEQLERVLNACEFSIKDMQNVLAKKDKIVTDSKQKRSMIQQKLDYHI